MDYQDNQSVKKFGSVIENECQFALSQLIVPNEEDLPQVANVFYELFIEDSNGDLVDIPVLIRNFRDASGELPNAGEAGESGIKDNWRLARRFFIYDTISGIDEVGGFVDYTVPAYVRWASEVYLKIQLDHVNQEQIYVPYLDITYREKQSILIHEGTRVPVKFVVDYT